MSAMRICTACCSASGAPNCTRVRTWATLSSSARWAKPTAAAPTLGRKRCNVPRARARFRHPPRRAGVVTGTRTPRRSSSPMGWRAEHAHGHRLEAVGVAGQREGGQAPALTGRCGRGEERVEPRDARVRDEDLVALEHPGVSVARRGRADAAEVAAGLGLGEGEGRDRLAARHLRQPLRAQGVAPAENQGVAPEALHREGESARRRGVAKAFTREAQGAHAHRVGRAGSREGRATVALGYREGEQAGGAEGPTDARGPRPGPRPRPRSPAPRMRRRRPRATPSRPGRSSTKARSMRSRVLAVARAVTRTSARASRTHAS